MFCLQDPDEVGSLVPYEIDRQKVELQRELGRGEFGKVMLGESKWVQPGGNPAGSKVAVKMLKGE